MDTETKTDVGEVAVEKRGPGRPRMEKPLPKKIRLTMMWGYIDDEGINRMWSPNKIIDDPDDIRRIIVDCKNTHYRVIEE